MTRDEVKKIILIIGTTYPNWHGDMFEEKLSDIVDVWATVLRDDDYAVIEAGLMTYIQNDTSGFAPTPGQIRQSIKQVAEPFDDTEEAMGELRKAVSKGSYHYVSEFENLSPSLKRAVGRAENLKAWAAQPSDEFESVTLSHIRKAYRNVKLQEKNMESVMPLKDSMLLETRERVERLTESVALRLSGD